MWRKHDLLLQGWHLRQGVRQEVQQGQDAVQVPLPPVRSEEGKMKKRKTNADRCHPCKL